MRRLLSVGALAFSLSACAPHFDPNSPQDVTKLHRIQKYGPNSIAEMRWYNDVTGRTAYNRMVFEKGEHCRTLVDDARDRCMNEWAHMTTPPAPPAPGIGTPASDPDALGDAVHRSEMNDITHSIWNQMH